MARRDEIGWDVKKPQNSMLVHHILDAYFIIAESRNYIEYQPRALTSKNIQEYLNLYEPICAEWLFIDCVRALDKYFLKKSSRANPSK